MTNLYWTYKAAFRIKKILIIKLHIKKCAGVVFRPIFWFYFSTIFFVQSSQPFDDLGIFKKKMQNSLIYAKHQIYQNCIDLN